MNRKIGIIGAFDFRHNSMGGQPVKTRQLALTLKKEYGENNVFCVDTHYWKKDIFNILLKILKMSFICEYIIMLPAANGVLYFSRILVTIKNIFGQKIYYDVIGGWLPQLIEQNMKLKKSLLKFDGIWVETNHMRIAMRTQGFKNIKLLRNYKNLTKLCREDLNSSYLEPYDICTFSRVMEEKGIEDAIHAVKKINEKAGRIVYRLHIYGAVDTNYDAKFKTLCDTFPDYIIYEGIVNPGKSVEILKDYFYLLFPTKFYTEGIPGTVIDAYAAGIPVVASMWESYSDVIKDGKTGICYPFGNAAKLIEVMEKIKDSPQLIINMKIACLEESKLYTETEFLKCLKNFI